MVKNDFSTNLVTVVDVTMLDETGSKDTLSWKRMSPGITVYTLPRIQNTCNVLAWPATRDEWFNIGSKV